MFKKLALCAILIFFKPVIYAQGIPTFDAANFAQAINQVLAWQQQYNQMVQQLQQLQQTNITAQNSLQSISGNRGLGLILNSIPQSVIPPDFSQQLNATKNPQDANAMVGQQMKMLLDTTRVRFNQIQQLMMAINTTNDTKAIGELNARIQAEQAMIANESKEFSMLQEQHLQHINKIHNSWRQTSINAISKPIQTK